MYIPRESPDVAVDCVQYPMKFLSAVEVEAGVVVVPQP
jgi:hypothetical protein